MGEPTTDLFQVVRRQRACRSFRPDALDEAMVERLLEAATFAPSAENRQPWVFVVVSDAQLRAALGELTRLAWAEGGRARSESRLSPGLFEDVDHGARGGVAGAPVIVVVCGDTRLAHRATLGASVYPAIQNLLLAATALGLGSAMTTLPLAAGDGVGTLLELPEEVRPMAVVPLGWPARPLGPPRRTPVADKAFRQRYGARWDPAG